MGNAATHHRVHIDDVNGHHELTIRPHHKHFIEFSLTPIVQQKLYTAQAQQLHTYIAVTVSIQHGVLNKLYMCRKQALPSHSRQVWPVDTVQQQLTDLSAVQQPQHAVQNGSMQQRHNAVLHAVQTDERYNNITIDSTNKRITLRIFANTSSNFELATYVVTAIASKTDACKLNIAVNTMAEDVSYKTVTYTPVQNTTQSLPPITAATDVQQQLQQQQQLIQQLQQSIAQLSTGNNSKTVQELLVDQTKCRRIIKQLTLNLEHKNAVIADLQLQLGQLHGTGLQSPLEDTKYSVTQPVTLQSAAVDVNNSYIAPVRPATAVIAPSNKPLESLTQPSTARQHAHTVHQPAHNTVHSTQPHHHTKPADTVPSAGLSPVLAPVGAKPAATTEYSKVQQHSIAAETTLDSVLVPHAAPSEPAIAATADTDVPTTVTPAAHKPAEPATVPAFDKHVKHNPFAAFDAQFKQQHEQKTHHAHNKVADKETVPATPPQPAAVPPLEPAVVTTPPFTARTADTNITIDNNSSILATPSTARPNPFARFDAEYNQQHNAKLQHNHVDMNATLPFDVHNPAADDSTVDVTEDSAADKPAHAVNGSKADMPAKPHWTQKSRQSYNARTSHDKENQPDNAKHTDSTHASKHIADTTKPDTHKSTLHNTHSKVSKLAPLAPISTHKAALAAVRKPVAEQTHAADIDQDIEVPDVIDEDF